MAPPCGRLRNWRVPTERLVHIVDEVPELAGVSDLTMVLVLDGFLDAGNAAAHAARHLADLDGDRGPGPVVATFDVDQFHDYRARRPAMSFVRDHYEAYDAPRLVVRLLHDSGGTPYLLLHGPEPDNRWEAFARAVREVLERLGVTRVVAMGSVPMAVPHTRPIAITPHANRPELVPGASPWRGELRIPSSAQSLLEVRLGEWGHDMLGFVAHIPHYLAQLDYPKAAAVLLEQVELAGRLTIDLTELHELAREREAEIDALPVLQRGGGRGGRGPRAAVRRLRAGRGVRARACSPTTSRCRPARRSAGSSSSSWPASTTQDGNDPNESGRDA